MSAIRLARRRNVPRPVSRRVQPRLEVVEDRLLLSTAAPGEFGPSRPTAQQEAGAADLSIAMSVSPDPAQAGSLTTYTIVVSNAGPDAARNLELINVVPLRETTFYSFVGPAGWTAVLPAVAGTGGTVTATTPSLASGAVATFTLQLRISPGAAAGATITNTVSVTATNDLDLANNTADSTVTVRTPPVDLVADLAVTQTGGSPPFVGSNFIYTIGIANNGPDPASGVVVTDVLPEGLTLITVLSSLASYDSATRTITIDVGNLNVEPGPTVFVMVRANSAGTITNVAHIQGVQADPDLANNTASRTDTVVALPAVGPQVVSIRRNGIHSAPTSLVVTFNSDMDPTRAQDVGNYQILVSGRGIQIGSAVYDASTRSVTIRPVKRINIHYPFLLTINGQPPNGLTDAEGDLLDGAGNGQSGTDYRANVIWYGAGTRVTPVHPAPVRATPVRAPLRAPLRAVHRAPVLSRPAPRFAGVVHNTQARLLARAGR